MRALKDFDLFVKEGIVKKQSVDKSRANALIKEARESYNFLMQIIKNMGVKDENSNHIIKNAYDVIMEIIRAKMLLKGFNSSGYGAHEAEVAYLRKLNFSETEILFANQLRYFRNGITYYGKKFDKDYAKKSLKFLEKLNKLK